MIPRIDLQASFHALQKPGELKTASPPRANLNLSLYFLFPENASLTGSPRRVSAYRAGFHHSIDYPIGFFSMLDGDGREFDLFLFIIIIFGSFPRETLPPEFLEKRAFPFQLLGNRCRKRSWFLNNYPEPLFHRPDLLSVNTILLVPGPILFTSLHSLMSLSEMSPS